MAARSWLALLAVGSVACGGSSSQSGSGIGVVQSSLSRDTSPQVSAADQATLAADNTNFAFKF